MSTNQNTPEPDDNNGFAELSSLMGDVGSEPDTDLSPTQAISEDGRIVELGGNVEESVHKDI